MGDLLYVDGNIVAHLNVHRISALFMASLALLTERFRYLWPPTVPSTSFTRGKAQQARSTFKCAVGKIKLGSKKDALDTAVSIKPRCGRK